MFNNFKKFCTKLVSLMFLFGLTNAATPQAVYNHSKDKVVKLGIIFPKMHGICSGAFIDNHGDVLTAAHCVSSPQMTKLFVKLEDESVYPAFVTKIDTARDLAVVTVVAPNLRTPYFILGDPVKRAQEVCAFGSPLDMQHTVSVNYVENIVEATFSYIIHGASVLPGSSGGPLVDMHGRLVGVNVALKMINPFMVGPGYCIAVDVTEIKTFLGRK